MIPGSKEDSGFNLLMDLEDPDKLRSKVSTSVRDDSHSHTSKARSSRTHKSAEERTLESIVQDIKKKRQTAAHQSYLKECKEKGKFPKLLQKPSDKVLSLSQMRALTDRLAVARLFP